jgi:hypothetical protein
MVPAWWRISVYVVYAAYATLEALTREIPISTLEVTPTFSKMAEVWAKPSLAGVAHIPFWWEQFSAVGLFILSLPFLAVFGPVLLSIKLGGVVWNLLGLWAIDKALGAGRAGLLAVALIAFACPVVTEDHLVPHGGFTQILLPFGLLLLLSARFASDAATMSRRAALLYGIVPPVLCLFAGAFGPGIAVTALVLVAGLDRVQARRLLPALLVGLIIGGAAVASVLLNQDCLTAHAYFHTDPVIVANRLTWFVREDVPQFLAPRFLPAMGYVAEAAVAVSLAWALVTSVRTGDRLLGVLVAQGLVVPLWIALCTHYDPEIPGPAGDRFRHYTVFWPCWAALLATFVARRRAGGSLSRYARAAAAATALILVATGALVSFGTVDFCHIGVTRRIPLASPIGRVLDEQYRLCAAPGENMQVLEQTPAELRGSLAFMSAFNLIIRFEPYRYSRVPQTAAALPEPLREPFLTGVGFTACEASLRLSSEAEQGLDELLISLDPESADQVRHGCSTARDWRAGRVALRSLSWPLDEQLIPTDSCRWLEQPTRYRTLPVGYRRPYDGGYRPDRSDEAQPGLPHPGERGSRASE